jgi:hypothetical protein
MWMYIIGRHIYFIEGGRLYQKCAYCWILKLARTIRDLIGREEGASTLISSLGAAIY